METIGRVYGLCYGVSPKVLFTSQANPAKPDKVLIDPYDH